MDDDVLVTRLIEVLAARCGWAWHPDGTPYDGTVPALFYGRIPDDPDEAIGLTLYDAEDTPNYEGPAYDLKVRRVQLWIRGARRSSAGADRLASAAKAALHGLTRTAGLADVRRVLVAPMGVDGNLRSERADSYQIITDLPEA